MKSLSVLVATAGLAGAAMGQLQLQLVNSIDLLDTQDPTSSAFIGSNPSAVAWDGTDMYVAGWNNGRGDNTPHGIVRIADAANSSALGTAFGQRPTLNFRGYLSVDVRNGQVAAAFENGAADAQGLAIYNGATGALVDSRNARPIFANWDPAVAGGNAVSWSEFGSGRLRVSDGDNLNNLLFDGTNGPVIFGGSTIWRGQDIDDSGNIVVGDGNGDIHYFARTDPNTTASAVTLASTTGFPQFTGNGINPAILNTSFGDFVMYNDRGVAGATLGTAIKAVDLNGDVQTIEFVGLSDALASATGWYDFDYDSATGTLAVVDFSNRLAWVFNVVPAPSSAMALGLAGLAALRRRR